MSKLMKSAVKRGEVRQAVEKSLVRRRRKNRRFKRMGLGAVVLGMLFLGMMFTSIISKGYSGFVRTELQLEIYFDPQVIDPDGTHKPEVLAAAGYGKLIKQSLRQEFPGVKKRKEKRRLYRLVSTGATQQLRDLVLADPAVIGSHRKLWLIVDDDVDQYYKHGDNQSRLKEQQLAWLAQGCAAVSTVVFLLPVIPGSRNWRAFVAQSWVPSLSFSLPWGYPCPWVLPRPYTSKSSHAETAGQTLLRSISTIWRPCHPSSSVCWGWRYSSTFSSCPARRRWWAGWCLRS